MDKDGDGVGDDRFCALACESAPDQVSGGGDCDDLDPLRFPARTEVIFDTDRCGEGRTVEPMSQADGWTLYASGAEADVTLMPEQTGCQGGGLVASYRLPQPTPCGPVGAQASAHCSWVVFRRELGAVDLSAEDYLVVPFRGSEGDPNLTLEIKLASDSCLRSFVFTDATDLPVKRSALIPLRWYSTLAPGASCAVDLSRVSALELGVADPNASATGVSATGALHLDAITAARASDLTLEADHFACVPADDRLATAIAADLARRQADSIARRGHAFIPSWYDESPPSYYLYNQALALTVFALAYERTGDLAYADAASALASELVLLQAETGDGSLYDVYRPGAAGGLVGDASAARWVGSVAWVVIALDSYRDVLGEEQAGRDVFVAIERGADWLESEVVAAEARGGPNGSITSGTEGNVSAAFAFLAAGRFARAQAIADHLIRRVWDDRERRLWMGDGYPGLAIDVMGGWGVDLLRSAGHDDRALASINLSGGLFPVRSFDDSLLGLGDIAGPWTPAWEFVAQYLAAGGPGGGQLLPELARDELSGAIAGSPDDFDGGDGWNTSLRGIAPSAMTHIALSGGILNRLHFPYFADGFAGDSAFESFDEIVQEGCYGTMVGSIELDQQIFAQTPGSLELTANGSGSTKSHHLIAGRRVASEGVSGVWTYELSAFIDPALAEEGETGPEFSLQNTRRGTDAFLTTTAGIQYLANPQLDAQGTWAIWTEVAPNRGGWVALERHRLEPGHWYRFSLTVDYDRNRYLEFRVRGYGVAATVDLSQFLVAEEKKFEEEALWVTLEAENRFNNCGSAPPTSYRVHYDDVCLRRRSSWTMAPEQR